MRSLSGRFALLRPCYSFSPSCHNTAPAIVTVTRSKKAAWMKRRGLIRTLANSLSCWHFLAATPLGFNWLPLIRFPRCNLWLLIRCCHLLEESAERWDDNRTAVTGWTGINPGPEPHFPEICFHLGSVEKLKSASFPNIIEHFILCELFHEVYLCSFSHG